MTKGIALKLIPSLMLAAFAGSAVASGFQLTEQSASGLGNAYAGSAAVAENASTIFYNPAGMTQLQAREFSLGGNAIKTSFQFSDSGSSVGALANSGSGGDGGGWGFVPNGYLSWALTKDLYLGVGVGAPFGLKTEYNSPWQGAAQSTMFDIKTYNINPSLAYRVNDVVSVGAGLNWQRIDAQYKRVAAINAAGSISPVTLDLADSSWGWNLGALFTLSPATKIGVSYRSAIKYDLTGHINVEGPAAATPGAISDVKADLKLPDTFNLSVSQDLSDRWQLLGDVSRTGWSSIPKIEIIRTSGVANGSVAQTLDTAFRNTWRIGFGANYKLNEAWKLRFGVAYDQTPVKGADTRLVSLPDNNRVWFSTGAQWKLAKESTLDVGVSYLYLKDAHINNDQGTAAAPLRGRVTGTYSDSAWILGAQYSMSF